MVTDITRHYSLLVAAGRPDLIALIDYPTLRTAIFEMDGVVSRKKQLFPRLSRLVSKLVKSD
jgi:manganese-dependent inorganic pyrophosphatase